MPNNIQQKIKRLLQIGENPRLALFQTLQEIEKEAQNAINQAILEAKEGFEAELIEIKANISKEIESALKEQILAKLTQIKGNKGDPGHTPQKGKDYLTENEINEMIAKIQSQIRIPEDGEPGKDGKTPIAGIDYPTTEQIRKMLMAMVSVIKVKDGKTPVKGVDYFTQDEIDKITSQIKAQFPKIEIKATEIRDKLQSLKGEERLDASAIKNLKKFFGEGKRMLKGAGGPVLRWESLTRVTSTTFLLPSTPYSSSTILFFLNGQLQQSGWSVNLSTRLITTRETEADEEAYAFYREA